MNSDNWEWDTVYFTKNGLRTGIYGGTYTPLPTGDPYGYYSFSRNKQLYSSYPDVRKTIDYWS